MLKIVSWNIARRKEPWRRLLESGADVALLQEASRPPPKVAAGVGVAPAPWRTVGAKRPWRTAIVRISQQVKVEWIETKPIGEVKRGELAVSRLGTLDAAIVTLPDGEPITLVSMYAPWSRSHESTGSRRIVSDASAHRVVSDLSLLVGQEQGHRILAAGDLNILYGYGERGSLYWAGRYDSVFKRMEAIGLPFIGPQAPNGRQAEPWPAELPADSKNVPTYYTTRQSPATATRQLDFVFASRDLAKSIRVRALNESDQWGPSDHCVIEVEVS